MIEELEEEPRILEKSELSSNNEGSAIANKNTINGIEPR
jgi:hypothetical protein